MVADLQAEGVRLPAGELGWFLKEKLGLDPLRKQLLDTALQGAEEYERVERGCSKTCAARILCIGNGLLVEVVRG